MRTGVIAVTDQARSVGNASLTGLCQISASVNQHGEARVLYLREEPEGGYTDDERCIVVHAHGRQVSEQSQQQGEGSGTDLNLIYVVCEPIPSPPGTTIAANAELMSPDAFDPAAFPPAHAYLVEDIVVPAVYNPGEEPPITGEVVATALYPLGASSPRFFEAGDYDPTYADESAGLVMGGYAWDIVSVSGASSPQSITLRYRGIPAMIVKIG